METWIYWEDLGRLGFFRAMVSGTCGKAPEKAG